MVSYRRIDGFNDEPSIGATHEPCWEIVGRSIPVVVWRPLHVRLEREGVDVETKMMLEHVSCGGRSDRLDSRMISRRIR